MEPQTKVQADCSYCKRHFPLDLMTSGEVIGPGVASIVAMRNPGWNSASLICADCLGDFRSEYIKEALKEEKGELSELDRRVIESLKEQETLTENLNHVFEKNVRVGQFVADKVATFGGSWTFIVIFFITLIAWMAVNSFHLLTVSFDPYPYILLNLVLSCLAAIQAPIILMSQNRVEAKDRLKSEHDYQINLKAELEIRHLHEKLDFLLKHQWQKLLEIQQIQLDSIREQPDRKASHYDKGLR